MILQAVLVACFATVALGNICCAPERWEGYQFTYGQFVQKRGRLVAGPPVIKTGRYQVSYDAVEQKVASYGNYTRNGQVILFRAINDYQTGRGYFILPKEKICTAFQLPTKFQAACIPDNAVDLGPYAFGIGENSLAMQGYEVRAKKNGDDVTTIVCVTQDGCVPTTENVYGTIRGATFFSNVGFNDLTSGIKDPSVFVAPDYCEEGPVEMLDLLHVGFSIMRL
ncbi:ependymin-related protein 1-like [Haliotis rubra]|uniref:ependymin-related protein 1-like n=1 Tax=Haliotis rubra TaxID=36100 RepID=UPI001EE5CF51|nr:ependymin-related protein 1-like [Haliotis rubra]